MTTSTCYPTKVLRSTWSGVALSGLGLSKPLCGCADHAVEGQREAGSALINRIAAYVSISVLGSSRQRPATALLPYRSSAWRDGRNRIRTSLPVSYLTLPSFRFCAAAAVCRSSAEEGITTHFGYTAAIKHAACSMWSCTHGLVYIAPSTAAPWTLHAGVAGAVIALRPIVTVSYCRLASGRLSHRRPVNLQFAQVGCRSSFHLRMRLGV